VQGVVGLCAKAGRWQRLASRETGLKPNFHKQRGENAAF
jgi:hypothetical protein